jgi:hypothetical protein
MPKFRWLAATLLIAPVPVLAQITFVDPPRAVIAAKQASAKSDTDKLECRMQDSTESRIGRHAVCLTKEQWLMQEHGDKEMARHIQEQSGAAKPF